MTDKVNVSENAKMGGSTMLLDTGEVRTVETVKRNSNSWNDAAVAIAEYLAGSEDAFVNMMNERASSGMNNTSLKIVLVWNHLHRLRYI